MMISGKWTILSHQAILHYLIIVKEMKMTGLEGTIYSLSTKAESDVSDRIKELEERIELLRSGASSARRGL